MRRQKRDLLSQNLECYMHCVGLVAFARERKEENKVFKQYSRFALSQAYHELKTGKELKLWIFSVGKNPVRLYPKLQSQPIELRKIFIGHLFFQADQSDCTQSVSIFNRFASSAKRSERSLPNCWVTIFHGRRGSVSFLYSFN